MKKLVLFLALFSTRLTLAGDLHLICFLNGDQGEFLEMAGPFTENNKIHMQFEHGLYTYDVLLTRMSLFQNYHYRITKIGKFDQSISKSEHTVGHYSDYVLADEFVTCSVTD